MVLRAAQGVAEDHNYSYGARLIEQRQAILLPEKCICIAGNGITRGGTDLGSLSAGPLTFEQGRPSGHLRWHDFTGTEHFAENPTGHFLALIAEGETEAVHEVMDDCIVVRMTEDLLGGTAKLTLGETEIDCSGLVADAPVGTDAVSVLHEQSFGGCGNAQDWVDADVKITWSGIYGSVTGTIKQSASLGWQFPVGLCSYYTGEEITIGSADTTLLWHITLGAKENSIVDIKHGKDLIARLTFKEATFKALE